jgi:hypothetical protein
MLRAAAVVILMLGLGACSGDELPDQVPDAQVRDGLAALFAGDHAGEDEAADARCFADELTDRVSIERLREAGVLDYRYRVPADVPPLPEDVAEDWVDAQLACVDFVEQSAQAQERLSKGKLDRTAYAACFREALTDDQLRAAVVATLMGEWDSPEVAALADAQETCRRTATPPDAEPST